MQYGEKRFSIWRIEFLYAAMWHDHDIDFARWVHPAMWHVALGTWQWIHQVAAPCSVIRGFGMTCHWIRPAAAPCNVTRSSGIITLNSPGGSTLQCGILALGWHAIEFAQTSAILESTSDFDFDHITASVDMSLYTSLQFFSKSDHPGQKKWRHVDFQDGGSQAILDFMGPIMGSLKSPCTTSYRSSIETIAQNCLLFEKIAFFCIFGDRQTNKQTSRRTASSGAAA